VLTSAPGILRRASIDLSAIVSNVRAVAGTSDVSDPVIDLRADAYGHGATEVRRALVAAGFDRFLESPTDADPDGSLVGSQVYGAAPGMLSTMRLVTEIVNVKDVPSGTGVSYGYTYRTAAPSRLVLCALGFADGLPRVASNRAPVLAAGIVGRVTGRVAMDQFVVDIGTAHAEIGDPVVLFGDPQRGEPSLLAWQEATGIPALAIVAGLRGRIDREYER
jgi:alanine racemase